MNNIEFSVGLPILKCSSSPSATKNAKNGRGGKTCKTKLCIKENLDRVGQDPDIDTDKSYLNCNLCNISTADEFLEELENFKCNMNEELKNKGYKQLRKDTVDNVSLIIKPAIEAMQQLKYEEQLQFLKDSKSCVEKIFREYINPDFQFSSATCHFDEENPHLHLNFRPLIFDDKKDMYIFNAKQFLSLKNLTLLNKNYSKEMQKLDWKVKDMNIYDDMSEEERKEYKKIKRKYGKSSLEYKSNLANELDKKNKILENKINENNEITDFLENEIKGKNQEYKEISLKVKSSEDNLKEYKKEQEEKIKAEADKKINDMQNDKNFSKKYKKVIKENLKEKVVEETIKQVAEMSNAEIIKQQQTIIDNKNKIIDKLEKRLLQMKNIILDLFENFREDLRFIFKKVISNYKNKNDEIFRANSDDELKEELNEQYQDLESIEEDFNEIEKVEESEEI